MTKCEVEDGRVAATKKHVKPKSDATVLLIRNEVVFILSEESVMRHIYVLWHIQLHVNLHIFEDLAKTNKQFEPNKAALC